MASSSPRSTSADEEDSDSEVESLLSVSVGYYPCEEIVSFEEKIPEDLPSNAVSSENLIPPIQGTWGTESASRRISHRNLVQNNPDQICKLGIVMSWDDNDEFDEILALENLSEGEGLLKRCPKDQTELTAEKLDDLVKLLKTFEDDQEDEEEKKKYDNRNEECGNENSRENQRNGKNNDPQCPELAPTEDVELRSSSETGTSRVSGQECNLGHHLTQKISSENENVVQAPEIVPMPMEEELAEDTGGEVNGNRNTCTADTCSVFSEQLEEDEHTTSCVRVGQLFRWLKKRILLTLQRRREPDQVTEGHKKQIPEKRRFFRSSKCKIQPEEQLKT